MAMGTEATLDVILHQCHCVNIFRPIFLVNMYRDLSSALSMVAVVVLDK